MRLEVKSASKPLKTGGNSISANPKFNFFSGGRERPWIPRQTRAYGARERPSVSPVLRVPLTFKHPAPSLVQSNNLDSVDPSAEFYGPIGRLSVLRRIFDA